MRYFMYLPDKPSELLEIALEDLEKCEKSPKYEIDMGVWHCPDVDEKCYVCLAGAVMAPMCHDSLHMTPSHFDPDTRNKLRAINSFRLGECADAFYSMGLSYSDGKEFDRRIHDYDINPIVFKADMFKLIEDLKSKDF